MIPVSFSFFFFFFLLLLLLFYVIINFKKIYFIFLFSFFIFFMNFFFIFSCSGMFRNVLACSGMFHVPGFIDGRYRNTIEVAERELDPVNVQCSRREAS